MSMESKSEYVSCSFTIESGKLEENSHKFYGSNTSFSDSDIVEPLAFRLNQFRLKGIGCDVVFIVGDERELVLGCSSLVFHAMFYGALGIASSQNNAITIMSTRTVSLFDAKKNNKKEKDTSPSHQQENSSGTFESQQRDHALNSDYLSERLHNISTRDDHTTYGVNQKQDTPQKAKSATVTRPEISSLLFGDDVEEEYVSDEEQYEDDEGTTEESLLCSTSSADCNLATSPLSTYFASMGREDANNINTSNAVECNGYNHSYQSAKSSRDNTETKDMKSVHSVRIENESGPIICGSVAVESIEVPDISPVAFGIMLDYIYNNYDVKCVELTDDNVMHTLYAAKKYDLHSLVAECVRYLLNGLSPCNAVCLLAQARFFQEEMLLRQCFEVIDKNTDTALQPANVSDVDRDTLMEVLARSDLDPSSELVVFEAARTWAEAECNRRSLTSTVDNLRECLGEALQLIRFPLMSVKEFGEVAKLHLLTYEEIAEVYMHLTVKPRPFCRYPDGFRFGARTKHTVNRFIEVSPKRCSRRENKICFTTDRDILVSALGIYGLAPNSKSHIAYVNDKTPRDWNCQVEIQLASVTDPCTYNSSICHSATNNVFVHGNTGDATPCIAYFDAPVSCQANVTYVASVRFISEITTIQTFQTYQGIDGKDSITVDLPRDDQSVTFKFQSYRNAYGNDEGGKIEGQIPALHFLVQWPQDNASVKAKT